ncbi:sugar nucleotide-binding protein [Candidatus Uabimicrobium sp. HlEnr_7]|uniref:sugar nucleotide-binding protein n=1 Tax=Candidatus Uabimicrobium helgolandensis TaxID=3095367 RepID=UPI003558A95F
MKILITGLNGTLAPILKTVLLSQGMEVISWDRSQVCPNNEEDSLSFLQSVQPQQICHLAMGSENWARLLAKYSKNNDIGFLFTSTAMVFDSKENGPYQPTTKRTAEDDYGKYKIRCEDAILGANDKTIIARIGWQIGKKRGGNNMLEFLYNTVEKDGVIRASRKWFPATSFMEDTCGVLLHLMIENKPGVYHIDSNKNCRLNFFDIVCKLRKMHATNWQVEPNDEYQHDQRLLDDRINIVSLMDRLPLYQDSNIDRSS